MRLLNKADSEVAEIRTALVRMQVQLKAAPFPVLVVIAGVEASGKGDAVNTLGVWLDPRGTETYAFHRPTDEERERPLMWRYWRSLPPRGRLGVYIGAWYTDLLRVLPRHRRQRDEAAHALQRVVHFEKLLARGGALIVKCWLDLTRDAQRERLKRLESDPRTAWRVTPEDWTFHRQYDRLAKLGARVREATQHAASPWEIIDATSPHSRDLAIGRTLLKRFEAHRRAWKATAPGTRAAAKPLRPAGLRRLHALPLDRKLEADDYLAKIDKWLGRLNRVVRDALRRKRSIVWVLEGWDAAGKGGAIRRLVEAIDPRDCRVIPVGRPTDEEKSHHYLWRFWRHVPRAGLVTIYDRSWYGRVLVERVEGFAGEPEWRRAYDEINDFEAELAEAGAIVLKFWLHIDKAEQLRRFRDRSGKDYKRHKMTDEDWRNRRKWDAYEVAVGDMIALTDRPPAPWHLVAANNKRHARLKIIKSSCKQIAAALEK